MLSPKQGASGFVFLCRPTTASTADEAAASESRLLAELNHFFRNQLFVSRISEVPGVHKHGFQSVVKSGGTAGWVSQILPVRGAAY